MKNYKILRIDEISDIAKSVDMKKVEFLDLADARSAYYCAKHRGSEFLSGKISRRIQDIVNKKKLQ
jgi:hypothetical protein